MSRKAAVAAVALAALAGAALVVLGVRSQPTRLAPRPAALVNDEGPGSINAHNSPAVATRPGSPPRYALADRIDTPRFSCDVWLSTTGGDTWKRLALPLAADAPNCFWPDVAFDGDGRLLVLYTATGGRFNQPVGGWLQRFDGDSPDGAPVAVVPPEGFHARLATSGADVWVTWVQAWGAADKPLGFPADPGPVLAAHSSDGGRSFSPAVAVSEPGRRAVQPVPVAVGGGRLVVGALDLGDDTSDYEALHGGQGGPPSTDAWVLVAWVSGDGGASFAPAYQVAAGLVPPQRIIVNLAPAPSFAWDPGRRRLYAAWDAGQGDGRDVFVARSDDVGVTWSRPARLGPRPRGQFLPAVAVAPGGRVDVVFYDRSGDPNDEQGRVVLASSADGGRTFTTARVSDAPFDTRIGFGSLQGIPILGSQLAVLSEPGRALAFWSDTTRGTVASNVQDLAAATVRVTPPASARPVLLGAGLLLLLGAGLVAGRLRPVRGAPQQA